MKLKRKTVVLAVAEATYGTDPGSGYTGLLTREGAEIANTGNTVIRDILRNTLSPTGHVVTSKQAQVTLPLELRGAGDAGGGALNVPEIDALLKACSIVREDGLVLVLSGVTGTFEIGENVTNDTATEAVGTVADIQGTTLFVRALQNAPTDTDSISGDTSSASATVTSSSVAYVYRPDSPSPDDMDSVTFHYYMDGIREIVTAARGTFTLDLTVDNIPAINFTFTGVYSEPTDTANATTTYLELTPAPAANAGMKIGATDMSRVAVNSLTFDMGNDVQPRTDIQSASGVVGYVITARDATGSVDPEVDTIAQFNPYSDWSAGNLVPIAAGIGNAFGNRIRLVMPKTQYTELPYADRNGIANYNLGFRATGDDDEMMLIYW